MSLSKLQRAQNISYAFVMRLRSYIKRDWALSDYPVRIRQQNSETESLNPRFTQQPFVAYIVNWSVSGTGNTSDEAKQNLADNFEKAKQARINEGKPIPRPGEHVLIEFADDDNIERNRELSEDFINRVLELQWAFISDESSLWDFHSEGTNKDLLQKIQDVYGIDVSDIESARLWEILDRIAAKNKDVTPTHA